jgi:hypothetical protein
MDLLVYLLDDSRDLLADPILVRLECNVEVPGVVGQQKSFVERHRLLKVRHMSPQ